MFTGLTSVPELEKVLQGSMSPYVRHTHFRRDAEIQPEDRRGVDVVLWI